MKQFQKKHSGGEWDVYTAGGEHQTLQWPYCFRSLIHTNENTSCFTLANLADSTVEEYTHP